MKSKIASKDHIALSWSIAFLGGMIIIAILELPRHVIFVIMIPHTISLITLPFFKRIKSESIKEIFWWPYIDYKKINENNVA